MVNGLNCWNCLIGLNRSQKAGGMDLITFDQNYHKQGFKVIAGVDEAGRGPWAGPVVAAAVIFPQSIQIDGIRDSKKLSASKREILFENILNNAISVGIGIVGHEIIDSVNILQATFLSMKEALEKAGNTPDLVLVDGNFKIPGLDLRQFCVVGGDDKSLSIAAASIIAKVTRDRLMTDCAKEYPEYGFQNHKGYGTKEHQEALRRLGPCPIHRKSYEPVRECLR